VELTALPNPPAGSRDLLRSMTGMGRGGKDYSEEEKRGMEATWRQETGEGGENSALVVEGLIDASAVIWPACCHKTRLQVAGTAGCPAALCMKGNI